MTDFNVNDPSLGDDAATESSAIVSQLHGGGAPGNEEFDLALASPPKKTLPLQAISVGLVLVVGAGALFLMRRAGTHAGIDFNTTVVVSPEDTTIAKIDNEEEILEKLASTGPPEQVPKEQVREDVFRINKLAGADSGHVIPGDPEAARREHYRVMIKDALGRLQVESVMNGRVPIAKISGKLYRIGDRLGGEDNKLFQITRIEDRSVYLSVDDDEHELSMVN